MARLLVIEDDRLLRSTLRMILEEEGHEVFLASSGEAGIRYARELLPDLIISDLRLQGLHGDEVLATLRAEEATSTIPFIFLTGAQDEDLPRRLMNDGADDFLAKPIRMERLLSSIKARLKRHSNYRQKFEVLRTQVTQMVSHEFNTPLNAVLGYSSLLLEMLDAGESPEPDLLREALQSIHQAGERLHHLNTNFILYTELSGRAQQTERPTGETADEWLAPLSDLLAARARRYQREADLDLHCTEVALPLHQAYLLKLLDELTDNAFKFSRPGQRVEVHGELFGEGYRLTIRDFGIGFAPARLQELDALQQLDRERSMQDGVGLGWPIAKLITSLHGGHTQVDSHPGEGTCVTIDLPLTSRR